MASTFLLKIITPNHEVYNGEVEKVFLKGADGDFGVLANHGNMISSTIPCIVKFKDSKGIEDELFISTSIVNITENQMTICSDAAEFEEDIDAARAEQAKIRAENRIKNSDGHNKERMQSALLRAKERLKLKKSNNK